jgi:Flp pilus assembly protein TadG
MSHEIRNISATGFYLLTRERWHPGTLVTMTLQRTDGTKENSDTEQYISVLSKVVRVGQDGVGLMFVPVEVKSSDSVKYQRHKPADKRALGRFLKHLGLDQGCVVIGPSHGDSEKETLLNRAQVQMPGGNIMKRLNDESGQALVITALCMTCLFGFVALAADVGIVLREKRLLQIAADSAAVAGAAELNYNDVTTAALAAATQNGFAATTSGTTTASGVTITVHNPPVYGVHGTLNGDSNANYVEVIASQNQPTAFMKFFGISSMTPTARAVATNAPSTGCIFTLNQNPTTPSGKTTTSIPGISVTHGASLTLPTCGILDDATDTPALLVSGGATISATSIGVAGTASVLNGDIVTPAPVSGITAVSDPLSYLTPPPASDYSSGCLADPAITKSTTIGPASPTGFVCYNGLTTPRGSPIITLRPGLYIFNGPNPLDISSGTTVNGTGVTFYFVNGASFTFTNGATLNLSAPTSAPYSGILFYQDPSDSAPDSFVGGSAGNINGIFYLPAANLSFENGNSSTFSTDLVVGSLTMTGAATLKPFVSLTGVSPISSPRLVE